MLVRSTNDAQTGVGPARDTAMRSYLCCIYCSLLLSLQMLDETAGAGDAVTDAAAAPSPEQVSAAEELVVRQGDAVRELKNLGLGNSHPEVQSQVQVRTCGGGIGAYQAHAKPALCCACDYGQSLLLLITRCYLPTVSAAGVDKAQGGPAGVAGQGSCSAASGHTQLVSRQQQQQQQR